ncbi:MAG TPA: hypothetical protein VL501_01985, partial [Pyrinomonadaceae bacterium]|nr:hypothetical protein [Pyrinomonadaceae bacterium]
MRKKLFGALLICVTAAAVEAQRPYVAEITKWRADHEKELRADEGWLTVSGLFWLKQGVNTVGSGRGYDVELTGSFRKGKFGEIIVKDGLAALTLAPGVNALAGDAPISTMTGQQISAPIAL